MWRLHGPCMYDRIDLEMATLEIGANARQHPLVMVSPLTKSKDSASSVLGTASQVCSTN